MNYPKLQRLRGKLYFTLAEVTIIWGIKPASARVLCNRYIRQGIFIRLKNNFYVLEQNWERFSTEEFLKLANYLQVPSYISFMTALAFYEVTTQVPRDFVESAALKRSVRFNPRGMAFMFYKLKKDYYFDFTKRNGIFMATKEKAFIDTVFLCSLGKYKVDFSSLDLAKLEKSKLKKLSSVFPQRTQQMVKELCKI
jgi:predicted transcriptional regulator of viral defense system